MGTSGVYQSPHCETQGSQGCCGLFVSVSPIASQQAAKCRGRLKWLCDARYVLVCPGSFPVLHSPQVPACPGSRRQATYIAYLPLTKANRVHSPAGSPDFHKWELCRTMPLAGGFSRGSPFYPAPSFRCRFIFTSITLISSQDLTVKSHPTLLTLFKMKYFYLPQNGSPVSLTPSFWRRSIFTLITLIGSQGLTVKSRPNLIISLPISPIPSFQHCSILASYRDLVCVLVRLFTSYQGEPGLIPGRITPVFSHVGIMPDDNIGRDNPQFPPPLHSGATSYDASPSSTLKPSMLRAAQISSLTRSQLLHIRTML
ncbi:hypothetical protein PR048_014212 [Dryococelus australis]|uniref:Uncharacterized protein n=1 Tax=Dryococelus australis TaxID=614101 RepID=A0ABQ9HDN8_9NEOP|nr:hypothetical protein PR048_014212 [Dryococelus australis]